MALLRMRRQASYVRQLACLQKLDFEHDVQSKISVCEKVQVQSLSQLNVLLMLGALQVFIDVARQNLPLLSGLPAPIVQAINKNDPEELQRIFRCFTGGDRTASTHSTTNSTNTALPSAFHPCCRLARGRAPFNLQDDLA